MKSIPRFFINMSFAVLMAIVTLKGGLPHGMQGTVFGLVTGLLIINGVESI